MLGVLLGAAVVALGVLAYFYYERRHEPVVKIDVPGFSGEIRRITAASTSRSARTGLSAAIAKPHPEEVAKTRPSRRVAMPRNAPYGRSSA